ncbi:MAG TPA: hypothetical protein V6C58_21460 [Allocoleopsis sp.]
MIDKTDIDSSQTPHSDSLGMLFTAYPKPPDRLIPIKKYPNSW